MFVCMRTCVCGVFCVLTESSTKMVYGRCMVFLLSFERAVIAQLYALLAEFWGRSAGFSRPGCLRSLLVFHDHDEKVRTTHTLDEDERLCDLFAARLVLRCFFFPAKPRPPLPLHFVAFSTRHPSRAVTTAPALARTATRSGYHGKNRPVPASPRPRKASRRSRYRQDSRCSSTATRTSDRQVSPACGRPASSLVPQWGA